MFPRGILWEFQKGLCGYAPSSAKHLRHWILRDDKNLAPISIRKRIESGRPGSVSPFTPPGPRRIRNLHGRCGDTLPDTSAKERRILFPESEQALVILLRIRERGDRDNGRSRGKRGGANAAHCTEGSGTEKERTVLYEHFACRAWLWMFFAWEPPSFILLDLSFLKTFLIVHSNHQDPAEAGKPLVQPSFVPAVPHSKTPTGAAAL